MGRALELAVRGAGYVSPNPMVGCVILDCNGAFLAEGWHGVYGGPHAEIMALRNLAQGANLVGATVYVTLEPCAHYGKTPPCALALSQLPIKRVVIACQDPNPLVAGQGIKMLEDAGISCEIGLLEAEAQHINRAFFWRLEQKMPYITLKWAQTADGFVARNNFDSKWITGPLSRTWVHKLRSEVDAVAVGGGTAFYDNPELNVRNWHEHQPARLVWATRPDLPQSHHLLSGQQTTYLGWLGEGSAPTWANTKTLEVPDGLPITDRITFQLKQLASLGIQHLLVEGGSKLLQDLIDHDHWNEAWVGTNPSMYFDVGIKAPYLKILAIAQHKLGQDVWSYHEHQLGTVSVSE